jgi:hypothetical protein
MHRLTATVACEPSRPSLGARHDKVASRHPSAHPSAAVSVRCGHPHHAAVRGSCGVPACCSLLSASRGWARSDAAVMTGRGEGRGLQVRGWARRARRMLCDAAAPSHGRPTVGGRAGSTAERRPERRHGGGSGASPRGSTERFRCSPDRSGSARTMSSESRNSGQTSQQKWPVRRLCL